MRTNLEIYIRKSNRYTYEQMLARISTLYLIGAISDSDCVELKLILDEVKPIDEPAPDDAPIAEE